MARHGGTCQVTRDTTAAPPPTTTETDMRKTLILTMLLAAGGLTAACTEPRTYPVSGQECGPDDPVRSVDADAADCIPGV